MNILNQGHRAAYIADAMLSEENIRQKNESYRRFQIYQGFIEPYLRQILMDEFDPETVREMRLMSSINFARRIVNDKASVYKKMPERSFESMSDRDQEVVSDIYRDGNFTERLKKSNKFFELNNQCVLQMLPKAGKLKLRVLLRHNLDVIPSDFDPEEPDVFLISTFDEKMADYRNKQYDPRATASGRSVNKRDGVNSKVSDLDDYLDHLKVVWWSKDYHFTTNGHGEIIDVESGQPYKGDIPPEAIENSLDRLPFIDVSRDKESSFWVPYHNSSVDFTMQMAVVLSDVLGINKLQGYAQPIISSVDEPKNVKVGANRVLWLKKNKDLAEGLQPTFQFATPNPDLNASLELVKAIASMYLSSEGQSPKLVSASGDGESYSSGFERQLAQFQKFEATQDVYDMYERVEAEVFQLVKDWQRALQGSDLLDRKYQVSLSEDSRVYTKFSLPDTLESDDQKLDKYIKAVDAGLMPKRLAIKEYYELETDEEVDLMLASIEADRLAKQNNLPPALRNANQEVDEQD